MTGRLIVALAVIPGTSVLAAAPGNWSYGPLRDDARVSSILREDVQSINDRRIGKLRDVLISPEGTLEAVVVEFNHGGNQDGFALGRFEWSDIALQPQERTVTVSVGTAAGGDDADQRFGVNGVPARTVIGADVRVADEQVVGNVADILVDVDAGKVTALLVETGDNKIALPVPPSLEAVAERGVHYRDWSQDDVASLERFGDPQAVSRGSEE